ncbi:hypothetical protein ACQW5G_05065 [Fructilactobacillus sp. Tb1]|uniref:hypothetical protein n=1 Tax=Fructilactobacillus sp. Tb1 TaxID=3422304 RepID=UPI003D277D60
MLNKIKFAFKKTNLMITIPVILIVLLIGGNAYLMYQNHHVNTKITEQNTAITKVSNEFATKYKKVEKKAKQEFQATHTDPLNQ